MIKVNKDLTDIPASLNSKTTCRRREEIIESGRYPSEGRYDSRYKQDDVKAALEKIYHNKCAYCEKNVGDSFYHIEHYRPKSSYYWLAYSWDNLLLCCDKCNVYKRRKFEIAGEKACFDDKVLEIIHELADRYNATERPMMVHPEIEEVGSLLEFRRSGMIESRDERVRYTIGVCRIDRKSANERRKKILDDLLKRYRCRAYEFLVSRSVENSGAIKALIEDFIRDSQDRSNEYLAFRRWVVRNLRELLTAD